MSLTVHLNLGTPLYEVADNLAYAIGLEAKAFTAYVASPCEAMLNEHFEAFGLLLNAQEEMAKAQEWKNKLRNHSIEAERRRNRLDDARDDSEESQRKYLAACREFADSVEALNNFIARPLEAGDLF